MFFLFSLSDPLQGFLFFLFGGPQGESPTKGPYALELFKKSLPTPEAASFVQLSTSAAQVRARALAEVRTAQRVAAQRAPGLDLIALALHGSAAGFEKVTAMIDEMVDGPTVAPGSHSPKGCQKEEIVGKMLQKKT